MIANNEPFLVQPKVALVDAGGNILIDKSDTYVHAYIARSLSQTSDIVIDTSKDSIPSIYSVQFHHSIID